MPINNIFGGVADEARNRPVDDLVEAINRVRKQDKVAPEEVKDQEIYDYELKKTMKRTRYHAYGVVGFSGSPIYGYFTPVPSKNIYAIVVNKDILVISKECVPDGYEYVFNNSKGYYVIMRKGSPESRLLLATRGQGNFPYTIPKFYNAEYLFTQFSHQEDTFPFENKYAKLLKYTLGIEFEASEGYLPQDECFKLGLIPLRDGSITSVEYATIVLDKSKLGLVKAQVEALRKYTAFDKECSLHMHLGGFPVAAKPIFALYKVCKALEWHLEEVLPKYSFRTAMYKRTRKDYCKTLPEFNTFKELYFWAADHEADYAGSLVQPHPNDDKKLQKWNIHSRYYFLNFVNMLFYDRCKTVEFRMLRPTYNFNRILFWIYSFNAILLYAEKLAANCRDLTEVEHTKLPDLTLMDIFKDVYPRDLYASMCTHLDQESYVTGCQSQLGDFIGKNVEFEDIIYTKSIVELIKLVTR